MNTSFTRFIFGDPNEITNMEQFRARLLRVMLISSLAPGTALYIASLIPVFTNGFTSHFIVYTLLYAWFLVILLMRRIPYVIRTGSFVTILYAMGVITLFMNGLSIRAGLFLLACVAITSVLLGFRYGMVALILSSITIIGIGIFTEIGTIKSWAELIQGVSLEWLAGGIIFLVIGILLPMSLTTLARNLDAGLTRAAALTKNLEQSNAALQVSEERFRAMVEDSADVISILGHDGTVQYISPRVEETLGYKKEELMGRKIFDYLHPEDVNAVVAAMTPGIPAEEIGPSLELRLRHKDGTWRVLDVKGKEMFTNPAVNGTVVIGRDITANKEIENALQTSHQLLAMVFASLSDAIFILDAKTSIIQDCNPAASTIFGYSREEMLGRATDFLYTDPGAWEEFRRHKLASVDETGSLSQFEFRMKRKEGTIFPTEHSVVPLVDAKGGRIGWVSVVHDNTERKRLEQQLQTINEGLELQVATKTQELREREQIQRAMLESTDQTILLVDLDGKILMANEIAARRFNRELGNFLGLNVFDLMPPELARSRMAIAEEIKKNRKPIAFSDEREGTWFDSSVYPVFNRDGQMDRVVLFARDITAQKRIEIALLESEEKYRALAEAAQDMIFIIDADDKILYVNHFAARQLGQEPGKIIGRSQSEYFPTEIAGRQYKNILETIQSGKPKYTERWSLFGPEQKFYLSTWLVPLNIPSLRAPAVLGVSRDITALKKAEEELQLSRDELETRVRARTKELESVSDKMRLVTKLLIKAQEDERRRISRELHDDTSQVLVTLKYSLGELMNEPPVNPDIFHEKILESIKATDEAMTSIRGIAHSLRPPLLDAGGLNLSLKDFCDDISRRTKITVIYEGMELDALPDEIAVTLYRFIQEAFSNILKHSRATGVGVKLQYNGQRINLAVADNGVGIHDPQNTTGIGLIGLRERIGFLGGEMQIKAIPGKGTSIKASIPWNGPDSEV
jgi:PAS domain S-box-containing protein